MWRAAAAAADFILNEEVVVGELEDEVVLEMKFTFDSQRDVPSPTPCDNSSAKLTPRRPGSGWWRRAEGRGAGLLALRRPLQIQANLPPWDR